MMLRSDSLRLALFSGGSVHANKNLSRKVLDFFSSTPTIAYIPAHARGCRSDFEEFCRSFGHKNAKFHYVALAKSPSERVRKILSKCDAIFLGGGNTFHFLHRLRRLEMVAFLKDFASKGGVLMGLSAGAILMTPSIGTASVPEFEADDNSVGLTDTNAFRLAPFEFSPHYGHEEQADRELKGYSTNLAVPVVACPDGSGVIVDRGTVKIIGQAKIFYKGRIRQHWPIEN